MFDVVPELSSCTLSFNSVPDNQNTKFIIPKMYAMCFCRKSSNVSLYQITDR